MFSEYLAAHKSVTERKASLNSENLHARVGNEPRHDTMMEKAKAYDFSPIVSI